MQNMTPLPWISDWLLNCLDPNMNRSKSDLQNMLCLSHGELWLPGESSKAITKHLAKRDTDSATVEIQMETQELLAAIGHVNGLPTEMELNYGQQNS